jgi:hypothetical protein
VKIYLKFIELELECIKAEAWAKDLYVEFCWHNVAGDFHGNVL